MRALCCDQLETLTHCLILLPRRFVRINPALRLRNEKQRSGSVSRPSNFDQTDLGFVAREQLA